MVQNGNLINTPSLRQYLDAEAHRHINTDSDSELLLNMLADNLQRTGKFRINEEDVFKAIGDLTEVCKGAYACVGMLAGFGLIAFRDPNGIRPIGLASRRSQTTSSGTDYVVASESIVADALGFTGWDDIKAGEAVIITRTSITRRMVAKPATFAPDIFEYVYFARPDSTIDGISVYRSRMAMGDALAETAKSVLAKAGLEIDVVIPVPDTSRVAALQVAQHLGIPYREGFVKNRYVGRTFIMPGQHMRRKNVRRKLNAMPMEFAGKTVMLVDGEFLQTRGRELWSERRRGANLCLFYSPFRLYRSWNDLQGDHPDGKRRWCQEGHRGLVCPSHPILQRIRYRHAVPSRARRARTKRGGDRGGDWCRLGNLPDSARSYRVMSPVQPCYQTIRLLRLHGRVRHRWGRRSLLGAHQPIAKRQGESEER